MKRGYKVSVHKSDCRTVMHGVAVTPVNVTWNPHCHQKHPVNIKIIVHDKPGLLSEISKEINKLHVNICSVMATTTIDRKGHLVLKIEVSHVRELLQTIDTIESLNEIISVERD